MDAQAVLRSALLANAGFSAASGLVLTIIPGAVAAAAGVEFDGALRLFGVVLLGHAVVLALAVRAADVRPLAIVNLVAIAPYPVAMLVAAAVADTTAGSVLALADGAMIGLFAAALAVGLRRHPRATPAI